MGNCSFICRKMIDKNELISEPKRIKVEIKNDKDETFRIEIDKEKFIMDLKNEIAVSNKLNLLDIKLFQEKRELQNHESVSCIKNKQEILMTLLNPKNEFSKEERKTTEYNLNEGTKKKETIKSNKLLEKKESLRPPKQSEVKVEKVYKEGNLK